ncbi:MAG: hypothetical protein JO276_11710 [Sphingomonadaceae bacterium]|nr:hypothetical protein [Sphingomonadaceae bacterium]
MDGLEAVAEALEQARRLLVDHGDRSTAPRLSALEERLRRGDESALASVVSEATGGMGSLNDRWLCRENGDEVEQHETSAVNKRLTKLVRDIEVKARSAAAKHNVSLVR